MNWLKKINIRQGIAKYMLSREAKHIRRERKSVSFAEAKKIGILYEAGSRENYELVKSYVRKLRSMQKEVQSLGFIDSKKVPGDQYIKLGLDFFTREHLSWWMLPHSRLTSNFIQEKFDILLNLNMSGCLQLEYISAYSKARYRTGRYAEGNDRYYDLMIHLKPSDDLKSFIEQTDHYMNLIYS